MSEKLREIGRLRKVDAQPVGGLLPATPWPAARLATICRVYVASDVRLYRDGLADSLAGKVRIEMVGAGSVADALRQIGELVPDVLLLDAAAPESLELPRSAMAAVPTLCVVAFAVSETAADVLACAEAGICGYIAKDGSVDDVVAAILRAVSGELICPPQITASLFKRVAALSTGRVPIAPIDTLTQREQQIAGLVASGLPNKAIANEMRLSVPTIKNHVHNILQKLRLGRRGELSVLYLQAAARQAVPSQ